MKTHSQDRVEFIARVKKARVESEKTQEQIADEIGIDRTTYTGYELRRAMPQKYIAKFCAATNVNEKWLLTGQGSMKEDPWVKKQLDLLAEIQESSRDSFEQVLINWPKRGSK